jgi:hypothetical protein
VQAQFLNSLSRIRSKKTHSYQEFESREPIERALGRAAMRDCPIARSELTPVNRSRSRTCGARIVARERVCCLHTGGASRAPIRCLNVPFMQESRDRKPQVGPVPEGVFRPVVARRISQDESGVFSVVNIDI